MLRAFRRRRSNCIRWSVWAEVRHGRFGAAPELVRHYGEPGDSVPALVTAHLLDAGGRRLRRLWRGVHNLAVSAPQVTSGMPVYDPVVVVIEPERSAHCQGGNRRRWNLTFLPYGRAPRLQANELRVCLKNGAVSGIGEWAV
jgi:hypothetical protein